MSGTLENCFIPNRNVEKFQNGCGGSGSSYLFSANEDECALAQPTMPEKELFIPPLEVDVRMFE